MKKKYVKNVTSLKIKCNLLITCLTQSLRDINVAINVNWISQCRGNKLYIIIIYYLIYILPVRTKAKKVFL